MLFKIFSGVAGAIKLIIFEFWFLFVTAFLIAEKTDIANINGGSPTALDLLTTFSMLKPFLYISTLNFSGISAAVGIL